MSQICAKLLPLGVKEAQTKKREAVSQKIRSTQLHTDANGTSSIRTQYLCRNCIINDNAHDSPDCANVMSHGGRSLQTKAGSRPTEI